MDPHFQMPQFWWHQCENWTRYAMACPYGEFDRSFEPPDDDDDREQDVLEPVPPPNEPRVGQEVPEDILAPPIFADKVEEIIENPLPNVIPFPNPLPQRIPQRNPNPHRQPVRPGKPSRGPHTPPGRVAATIRSVAQTTYANANTAAAQNPANIADAIGKAKSSVTKIAAAKAIESTVLSAAGASGAAAASRFGSNNQFGPPSAKAEIRSSAIAAEAIIAKTIAERSRGSSSPRPAPAGKQTRVTIPAPKKRSRARDVDTSPNQPRESDTRVKETAAKIAKVAAAVGAGALAIKAVNTFRGGPPSGGGYVSRSAAFNLTNRGKFSFY